MSASLPLLWSCGRIRLPGWGSLWKNPTCSSWVRKTSCPTSKRSLTWSGVHSDSLTPSTHSVTSTRRLVYCGYTAGIKTSRTPCASRSSRILSMFAPSFLKSSSV